MEKVIKIDMDKPFITTVKEDINLAMFNSPQYSVQDMKLFNDIIETMKNIKFNIIIKDEK